MRSTIILLAAALVVLGCSKEEQVVAPQPEVEATAEGEAPMEEAAVEPAVEEDVGGVMQADSGLTERLQEDIQAIPTALETADYDTAVNSLGAMSQVPMNAAQSQAYQEALRRAQAHLLEKAATDAEAREAYKKLGRQVTGR
jgi:hypothetical protein